MATAPALPAYERPDGPAVHEQMLALLTEWNAPEIETHMRRNYSNYRYFGVSALGAQPDYDPSNVAPAGCSRTGSRIRSSG